MLPKGRKNVEIFFLSLSFSFFSLSTEKERRKSKKVDCQQFVAGDEIQFIFRVWQKKEIFATVVFHRVPPSEATINEAKGCWVEFN